MMSNTEKLEWIKKNGLKYFLRLILKISVWLWVCRCFCNPF
jgi:hypothetical protein